MKEKDKRKMAHWVKTTCVSFLTVFNYFMNSLVYMYIEWNFKKNIFNIFSSLNGLNNWI